MKKPIDSSSADFRGFLSFLERQQELLRVVKNVSTEYEVAALTAKLDGKQASLFSNVRGCRISSLASNVCGSPKRFYMAIAGSHAVNIEHGTIRQAIHERIIEALSNLSQPATLRGTAPFEKNSSKNLFDLPVLTHFEKDAGPYVTSSVVFAKDQEKGNQNSSTHRLLRLDESHMVIRMVEGRHLHKCYAYAREHGEDLRIAITIGVHPAVSIAAAYQAAYGTDEMFIANSLLDGKLQLTRANSSNLLVPSHAEILLEGRILRDLTHEEWMVEMLRTYDFRRKQPVFELEKISFRDGAICHDILPGYAEHRLLMGLPVEAKMYDYVKNVVPTTRLVHLTDGGCNWLDAVIQIRKRLEGEPKNALLAAFASHPSLKMAIVVDEDIDPTDPVAIEYAIATRCQGDKDFVLIPNAKGSSLDPSSDQTNLLTTKVGIDATATLLKPKDRFEIARIPGEDKIRLQDYISNRTRE